ncbi:inhibitor of Bruton tyrosine kinase isoform X1 [Carcharodon carcharias]|uniref:inhibitor of Bruton tyrosine kinase isoform X1 n=2 Tax=Carcharodon carcharias TaxID=13397 RepID=UPI001B7F2AE1|nr:inhibitor of Bruton tyrosine kinase isoform X1 [Carcharodon carcharias]XP_041043859.1 inhibitor of Bruton tyrosine kinase isoform X1 [Carcharodon carcharias]XP_041043860.1 inhibitor of Bruton tyrosine kinase isoform X1 [Carcharodon carcharias]
MNLVTADCTPKCRSLQHALDMISVMTKGTEGQSKAFLSSYCYNAASLKDSFGRTVLHMAASCGKKSVLDWLLEKKRADHSVKDKESGWTALHRSIFYGHIDCAMFLLKHGSSLYVQDKEGLSILDLAMKDRPSHVIYRKTDPTEVYTWGNNTNFTLGHGSQQSKHHPELVDFFSRSGIYIKEVVLCKFHSVFLSQKGQVYTCGHGQGGRLGHGDEQTYLVPRMVEGLASHRCSRMAAAKDHTIVLTEDGSIFTFGLNTYNQLGIAPPPANSSIPRQVQSKTLKGRTVIGVAVGRFHTVLWTREALYTMGLNGGQLGYLMDPNGERCVLAPRQVSALHHKDIVISLAAASDGATVCVTERGDVYLLTGYQCKKIASRQLNLKKVLVTGGHLDHKVDPQVLNEGGGENICILALDEAGRVFCWRSSSCFIKQCRWAYGRQVFMSDIALSKNEMIFVTQDGDGFTGHWTGAEKTNSEKKEEFSNILQSSLDQFVNTAGMSNNLYERIKLEKLPCVHRAVSVTMDLNGRNFAILQSDPKTSLYEIPNVSSSSLNEDFGKLLREATETDSIHDITCQVGNQIFPSHKYILAMRSDYFRKLFFPDGENVEIPDAQLQEDDAVGCDLYILDKIQADLFANILQFIYTDTCDLLTDGYKPKIHCKDKIETYQDPLISKLEGSMQKFSFCEEVKGKSASEVYENQPCKKPNTKSKNSKKTRRLNEEANPVKMLQVMAKKFGLASLSARLDGVKLENWKIKVVHKKGGSKLKFSQKKCSYLCDVTLRSEDGKEFVCHKCVLCARLEYFHRMLSNAWIEASCCTALEMPIHSDILEVILDYIYTGEAPAVKESQDVEFICNVLVVADQLLISRLKEICEVAITEKLTLKNTSELLEFAAMYNAEQLKLSCLQFIGLNMAALLEARSLDILSDEVLKELSVSYRNMIPAMQNRIITPYPGGPDISSLGEEIDDNSVASKIELDIEQSSKEMLLKKAKVKAKKKQRRRSDSSGGYHLSDLIQSPTSTDLQRPAKTNSVESLQEMLMSDSEGSYAGGVASPRELASPDFSAGFCQEKLEIDERAHVSEMKNPTEEAKMNEKIWTSKRESNPKPIPRSNSGSATGWVTSSFSPASPPTGGLRAIMEMEENMQKCVTAPKTNASGNKSMCHGVKLSQKQRKMIAMAAKEPCTNSRLDSTPVKSNLTTLTPSKTGNAWVTPFNGLSSPKSFRDLLVEEKSSEKADDSLPSSSWENNSKQQEQPSNKYEQPTSPWLMTVAKSPPAMTPITFAAIVEEERQQEAALVKSREKPLALIQIEERAIQDLLIHYQACDNPEEFIMIDRSPQGPIATPIWSKH